MKLNHMTNNTDDISTIPPTDFEDFIAELWEELGWKTTTTPSSGDDGIDVIVQREEPYEQRKLIQVKQREDRLNRSSVQQYSYLHHKDNVDEVLLVATSGFTRGATESAQEANVKLIGPDKITKLVKEADADHLVERYVGSDVPSHNVSTESDTGEKESYSYETEKFEEISSSNQVYADLANTIPGADMCSPKAKLAITLQFFRGNRPLHVLLIEQKGEVATTILKKVVELCDDSAYVNCQTTTEGGLIGRYNTSGRTHTGVFTRYGGVVAIDDITQLPSPDICKEPLTQQQITISRANFHRSYPTQFSCLATEQPKYGVLDEYEGLSEQIDTSIMHYFDCVCIISEEVSSSPNLPEDYLGIEDGKELSKDMLVEYSKYANDEYPNPEITTGAKKEMGNILTGWEYYNDGVPVSNSTRSSFVTVAKASARMRLSDNVREVDVVVASNVLAQNLGGTEPETGEFDIDIIDSATDESEIKGIKDIIRAVAGEGEKASLSEIIDLGKEHGMSKKKIEEEVDSLRRRGEVIEPDKNEFMLI